MQESTLENTQELEWNAPEVTVHLLPEVTEGGASAILESSSGYLSS